MEPRVALCRRFSADRRGRDAKEMFRYVLGGLFYVLLYVFLFGLVTFLFFFRFGWLFLMVWGQVLVFVVGF